LFALAQAHDIELVGGDTTAGPLNLCITVLGEVPAGQALLRSGASPGDELWVSGTLGDARLALEVFRGRVTLEGAGFEQVRAAMEWPQPRVGLGLALRGVATAAIDLSDGLVGDLGHLLQRSGVGAQVALGQLPHSQVLAVQPPALRQECLLAGGDDYELLFCAPPARRAAVLQAAVAAQVPVQCIGRITAEPGLQVLDEAGQPLDLGRLQAFDHFKS
jgi:thiamine-monophosphate kinase